MSTAEGLPRLVVEVGGRALEASNAKSLSAVRVLHRLSLPSLCELTFQTRTVALLDDCRPSIGDSLRVSVGDGEVLFDGELTAMHHAHDAANGHELRLRGFDPLHRLRKRQSIRSFQAKTLAELAGELVADLGFTIAGEDTGPVWPRIVQWHQSDLDLLIEIANRCGQYFVLKDGEIHFVTLEGNDVTTSLTLGESLLEAAVDASTESSCRSLDVHAWDPWHSELYDGNASHARSGREIPLEIDPARVGSDAQRSFADETLQSSGEAACLAQAELDRRVAAEIVLRGIAAGNAELRPGSRVAVEGLARQFCGSYVLTAVTHTIDRESGFRSAFDTTPPNPRPREHGTVCTLGHVVDADDPAGLGRVQVSLPGFAGIESDWLGVVVPGAGAGKGLICLPDKGDRVLVLLPRSDPAQGVVLGGLYGNEVPPDSGVEAGQVQRFTFMTPGGQRLQLDDENESVCVETSGGDALELRPGYTRLSDRCGNYVEMNDKHVRVHSSADLELEAPGNAVRVRGARIDFEQA